MKRLNQPLQHDHNNIKDILARAKEMSEAFFSRQEKSAPGIFVKDITVDNLPDDGIGAEDALKFFETNFADKLNTSAGPRYFGFVVGGSTPAAIAGDWLVSAYDQNAFASNDSIAPQIERQAIHFLKQLFGFSNDYYGTFVSGATMSNFTNLAVARQWIGEQRGVDFSVEGIINATPITVLSATPHSSILKALSMLGIGKKSVVKIKTLPEREAIDVKALEDHLREINAPVIVVANAGTVNTVDFDDLEAIGKLKSKYNFWLHVDAAFGGFAGCSPLYSHYLDGINYADSITVDGHKWLNVPYDSGMQFTHHQNLQLKVFSNFAPYLGGDSAAKEIFQHTPENSRRFRALPAWFTLMAYGKNGYREIVDRNCSLAKRLGDRIIHSENFTLLAPVRMNVVCFTINVSERSMSNVQKYLDMIRDDGRTYLTPTLYNGTPGIRAAISNWQTQESDIDLAFKAMEEVLKKLLLEEALVAK